jgi:hypothetical protein
VNRASTEALTTIQGNLLAGLSRIAEHVDAGTFHTVGDKGKAPPAQSGQTTLALLHVVEAELTERHAMQEADTRPEVILCDVDGTIALMGKSQLGRRHFADWSRVGEDDPNPPIIRLVRMFRRAGFTVIYVSGRDEVCREQTLMWLDHHLEAIPDERLLMRPRKDNRPDHEIKLEIYRRDIEPKYRVAWVIDDRNQVVKMWRSLGLTVLQVADGEF